MHLLNLWCRLVLLLLPVVASAQRAPAASPRRAATALWATTRREADSLRLWVGWGLERRALTGSLLLTSQGTTTELSWADTLALRPVAGAPALRTFAVSVGQLAGATRLRLRELPLTDTYLDVPVTGAALARPYVLADSAGRPLARGPWARAGETLRLAFFGLEQSVTLLRYGTAQFAAALPPMAEGVRPPAAPILTVTQSRELAPNDTFRVAAPGLYALRVGATGDLDPLLVEDVGFPEIRTVRELIQPLIYLTTREERQRLYDAPQPKKATDTFWLDVAQGDQEVARELIRAYYGRVSEANQLFTCHKVGWMTDRGMLWIVLGPPPRVEITSQGEDWVYQDVANAGGARFRFRRRPAVFAPDQVELIRDRDHERVWYAATASWRKGTAVTSAR